MQKKLNTDIVIIIVAVVVNMLVLVKRVNRIRLKVIRQLLLTVTVILTMI
jgi:hypothetical protein